MQVNQSSIATITSTYGSFLQSGATFGKAMQDIAKKLNGTPCPKLIEALAKTHATHYKCTTKLGNRGNWVFEVKGERLDSARKSWERNVSVFFAKQDKPAVSKQVDEVEQAIKRLKAKFTKQQLNRIAKALV